MDKGQINPNQAARDERRDARVERQLKRDEAKHGGHITKREQAKLNRELNHNSKAIHNQRHNDRRLRRGVVGRPAVALDASEMGRSGKAS